MLPHKHVAVSTAIGAIGWWSTGTPAASGAALLAGVLPDLDHAADYVYYYLRGTHRLILPLHGYEYGVIGAIAAVAYGSTAMWVAVLSYLVHLLADQAENKTRLAGYFLLFRLWHRFRIEEISTTCLMSRTRRTISGCSAIYGRSSSVRGSAFSEACWLIESTVKPGIERESTVHWEKFCCE